MATQITNGALAGTVGQRKQGIGGRLAGNGQLRGLAIIAALVLATTAGLAIGRALEADSAGSAAGVAIPGEGPGFTAYREEHASAAAAQMPGLTERREDHRLATTISSEPGFTAYREDHRQPATVAAPMPGFTEYREDHRP